MVTTPKPVKKAPSKPAGAAGPAPAAPQKKAAGATGVGRNDRAAVAKSSATATAGGKPAAAASASSKAAAASKPLALAPSPDATDAVLANMSKSQNANAVKKKDLIDRVLAATGAKKKLVKEIVEATLTVLGDALSKGEMLNVPPFGKAKVSRPQDAGTSKAMTVKLRRTSSGGRGGANPKQALADAEE